LLLHSVDGGIGEKFHLIADVERFVGDTFQSCFFLEGGIRETAFV
jgi:hypothetical protein